MARFTGVAFGDARKNAEGGRELVAARVEVKAVAKTAGGALYAALNEKPGGFTDSWAGRRGRRRAVGCGCERQEEEEEDR